MCGSRLQLLEGVYDFTGWDLFVAAAIEGGFLLERG